MERKALFDKFIKLIKNNNITYAIVGRTENYPNNIDSDIDIIIHEYDIPKFHKIIWEIENENTKIVQMLQHEIVAFYYVIFSFTENERLYIQPDVCSNYYRKGRKLLTSKDLLHNIKEAPQGGFNILSPEKEFIYYFLKKIDKQFLNDEHFTHLTNCFKQAPQSCCEECKQFWNTSSIQIIKDAFSTNDICLINNHLKQLQKEIHLSKPIRHIDYFNNLYLKFKRIFFPTGFIICILGPDGSGKTTVMDQFKKDIAPAFRHINQYHLFPIPQSGQRVNTDPHSKKQRGYIMSIVKLLYFVLLYNYGYLRYIFIPYIKSGLIIFDRYFDDILIDPLRYRNKAPNIIVKFFRLFIPKPHVWIVLDAPTAVIQSRKSEVSPEETERQRNAYKKYAKEQKNCILISTDNEIKSISYEICIQISKILNNRTSRRLKK